VSGKKNNAGNNAKQRAEKQPGGVTGRGFHPGKSGNPAGRPKGVKGLLVHLRKQLEEAPKGGASAEEVIVQKLVQLAKAGDLAAIKLCFDRTEGLPRQQVDWNDMSKELECLTDEELKRFIKTRLEAEK
jgi:hypothetical protein